MENLYKQRFPKRTFDDTVFDVLRMKHGTTKWKQFQDVAKQFQGGSLKPKKKLLPSAIRSIANVDSPSTLAALMHQEKIAHDQPDLEYHMGGGIYETAGSIFSTLWGITGKPTYEHWFGHHESHQKNKETRRDRRMALGVREAYKPVDERGNIGDWTLLSDLSNDRFAVFKEKKEHYADEDIIHVALRGTKGNMADLWKDMKIIHHNNPDDDKEIRDKLVEIARAFPEADLDASGHSLGGNQLVNAFEGFDDAELKRYERVNLFNPGTSPFSHLDTHKEAAANDSQMRLFLNTGDVLSNTYTYLIDAERDNVVYSAATHNPLSNHGLSQWIDY